MALLHSFESSGNLLFKYRGQMPVILFLIAIPAIYFTDYGSINETCSTILIASSVLISTLGFIIRCYTIGTTPKGTSGRNTQEQVAEALNSTGIYSVVRHPLYLGNFLMWIGIVLYIMNFYFVIIVCLLYWIYYERIMFAEERFLERKFGQPYLDWSLKAPAFIPAFSKFVKSSVPFSLKSVLRREYSGVLATVFGFFFINVCKNFFAEKKFEIPLSGLIILIIATTLTLILRTIKHQTKWLAEEGRS